MIGASELVRAMFGLALAALACVGWSAEGVRVCLNWAPGADHAPFYFARAEGWFADADVAVEILPGGGSGAALQKLARGECESAVADFGALRVARAAGTDPIAVMAVFADSPLAFYSLDGDAVTSPTDLAGKRVAGYTTDPPRRLWPAFAARTGLTLDAITWIDLPNNAKVEALAHGAVAVAANGFYHHHVEYVNAFGERLRILWWRDVGVNPYGNVLALSGTWASSHPRAARAFVRAVQRAYAACAVHAEPCLAALLAANPHLEGVREHAKWEAVRPLIAPARLAGTTLGAFDPKQAAASFHPPLPAAEAVRLYDNGMLDPAVVVPAWPR